MDKLTVAMFTPYNQIEKFVLARNVSYEDAVNKLGRYEHGIIPVEDTSCEFCRSECSPYVNPLPRVGEGNAHIQFTKVYGPVLQILNHDNTSTAVPIKFCPICGGNLRESK